MKLSEMMIGFIRTWVPTLAGAVATWGLSFGIEIDTAALGGIFFAVFSGIYYLLIRLLAEKWPGFGALLGVNKAPSYDTTDYNV